MPTCDFTYNFEYINATEAPFLVPCLESGVPAFVTFKSHLGPPGGYPNGGNTHVYGEYVDPGTSNCIHTAGCYPGYTHDASCNICYYDGSIDPCLVYWDTASCRYKTSLGVCWRTIANATQTAYPDIVDGCNCCVVCDPGYTWDSGTETCIYSDIPKPCEDFIPFTYTEVTNHFDIVDGCDPPEFTPQPLIRIWQNSTLSINIGYTHTPGLYSFINQYDFKVCVNDVSGCKPGYAYSPNCNICYQFNSVFSLELDPSLIHCEYNWDDTLCAFIETDLTCPSISNGSMYRLLPYPLATNPSLHGCGCCPQCDAGYEWDPGTQNCVLSGGGGSAHNTDGPWNYIHPEKSSFHIVYTDPAASYAIRHKRSIHSEPFLGFDDNNLATAPNSGTPERDFTPRLIYNPRGYLELVYTRQTGGTAGGTGGTNKVWRSTSQNEGITWEEDLDPMFSTGAHGHIAIASPSHPIVLYSCYRGGTLYGRTQTGGEVNPGVEFNMKYGGSPIVCDDDQHCISVSPSGAEHFLLTLKDGGAIKNYYSFDYGKNWELIV